MKFDAKNLRNIDLKELTKHLGVFLAHNRFIVSSVVLLLVTSLVLLRISSLIRPTVDVDYLESQTQTQQEIEFDEESIIRLEELNDSRIEIESDFTDRNNPFVDPN